MSLKIIKAGILDTVQDTGRYGHQHQGINPGGAMDRFSASLANALLGKETSAAIIEMHYPAPQLLFQDAAVICLTGADFTPVINDREVPLHQPVIINQNAVLAFLKKRSGACCYLALLQGIVADSWLNSHSTNLKAEAGGYKGRRFMKNDVLEFETGLTTTAGNKDFEVLPWHYRIQKNAAIELFFIPGPEWNWLTREAQTRFLNAPFFLTPASDRMGFRLSGEALEQDTSESLVSSPVVFGTVQLLPNGQLIVLMADHQTTGGYPRIATVISVHLPKLAQATTGEKLKFVITTPEEAEEKLAVQQQLLQQLQATCKTKMQNRLYAHRH